MPDADPVKTQIRALLDAIEHRNGEFKVMRAQHAVDKARLARLVKHHPEAAQEFAAELKLATTPEAEKTE